MTSGAEFQDLDLDIHWDFFISWSPLEVLEKRGDVVLGDVVSGDGLGLNLVVLVVSFNCNNPIIPCGDMAYWSWQ